MDKTLFGTTKLYGTICGNAMNETSRTLLAGSFWPTIKDEEWKYTNLSSLANRAFRPASLNSENLPSGANDLFRADAVNLVFINGIFSEKFSELKKLPSGLRISFAGNASTHAEAFRSYLEEKTANDAPSFLELNRACSPGMLLIETNEGMDIKPVVQVIHVIGAQAEGLALSPRVFVHLTPSSGLRLLESCVSLGAGEYLNNPVIEAIVEDNAFLEYGQVCSHSSGAFHIGSARFWAGRDSRMHSFIATTGARVFRNNLSVLLTGEGAEVSLNGLHSLKDERHADSHTFIHHQTPNARSNQLYKCILDGESHSVFNGKVVVDRKAQLTNSYQLNKNLLLSRESHVDTKPELQINADDVKCSHGATIGQLNDEELFYLETRGINTQDAARMLTRGFVDDVLNQIQTPLIREVVSGLIAM